MNRWDFKFFKIVDLEVQQKEKSRRLDTIFDFEINKLKFIVRIDEIGA